MSTIKQQGRVTDSRTTSATKGKKGTKSLLPVKIRMAVLMSKLETATGTVRVTRMRPGDFSTLGAASENGLEITVLHMTMHIANARTNNADKKLATY